jgi:hypothetical protein
MKWKCPACQTPIRPIEGQPSRPDTIYRCHTCRLELLANDEAGELVVAPLPAPMPERRSSTRRKQRKGGR